MGGTELLSAALHRHVDTTGANIICSKIGPDSIKPGVKNILWQHLSYDQPNVKVMNDPELYDYIDAVVFVSHWQYNQFIARFKNIPTDKCHVIQNATTANDFAIHQREGSIHIVYTSTPWRGLNVLLEAFAKINRDDVDLTVYSGTSIYGPAFYDANHAHFKPLYHRVAEVGGTHIEYADNATIRQALSKSHIFAYPSTWQETSCLAAIEALAAGCSVVTTNFGALPETCGSFATYVPISTNLVDRYADALNRAIDTYHQSSTQTRLSQQVRHYNLQWSWEHKRADEWRQLLDSIGIQ